MTNKPNEQLSKSLADLVQFRREHLKGDEKGEAQVFLDRLFRALGHEGLFEAGATLEMRIKKNDQGGTAFADLVWRPRVLIEMKKGGEPLEKHYQQAFSYWLNLVPNRPTYVVLCNFDELWIYDLNRQLDEPVEKLELEQLPQHHSGLMILLPQAERPTFNNDLIQLTRKSASLVSGVFHRLKNRGIEPDIAQRFVLQSVMALFAEDIRLLPQPYFKQALEDSLDGGSAYDLVFGLFTAMNREDDTPSGRYKGTRYFNGGLFRKIDPIDLQREELEILLEASEANWAGVRPAIFGTLFEQSLDHDERHAYGAHFTSETDIQKVVRPTIVDPWEAKIDSAESISELEAIAHSLQQYRVLDPACGCGNFLYIAYQELRRLEKLVSDRIGSRRRSEASAAATRLSFVSTTQFFGIDIRDFAVEIAKVTMMLARKIAADRHGDERIILPLDDLDENITCGDSLFEDWPEHAVTIGNPPYLGRHKLTEERGAGYAAQLDAAFPDVQGFSDYVAYFFQRTHDQLKGGQRAGLVATQAVRRGNTRDASTEYIIQHGGTIIDAVSSQPWSGDAQVHVSIVNWIKGNYDGPKTLWLQDGELKMEVDRISGALSASVDLIAAASLKVNKKPKRFFQGQTPQVGDFVIEPELATGLVADEAKSTDVIHPYLIGKEIGEFGAPQRFVIDLPDGDLAKAQRHGAVLRYLEPLVLPIREAAATKEERDNKEKREANPVARLNNHHLHFLNRWWQLGYRRSDMLEAIAQLDRYTALSRVAVENRPSVFVFVDSSIRPGDALQVFDFNDEYSLGILSSSVHQLWFRERCSAMKSDPRYTSRTVFDSFPWPQKISEDGAVQVAQAMKGILEYRSELVEEGISLNEMYKTFDKSGINKLRDLHKSLDQRVMQAYGFSDEDDVLEQLLALNLSIAKELDEGLTQPRGPGNQGLPNTKLTSLRISSHLPNLT